MCSPRTCTWPWYPAVPFAHPMRSYWIDVASARGWGFCGLQSRCHSLRSFLLRSSPSESENWLIKNVTGDEENTWKYGNVLCMHHSPLTRCERAMIWRLVDRKERKILITLWVVTFYRVQVYVSWKPPINLFGSPRNANRTEFRAKKARCNLRQSGTDTYSSLC